MRIARPAAATIGPRGFQHRVFEAFCLFLIVACCMLVAWSQARGGDLLDLEAGAVILTASTEYDSWPALALLDQNPYTGWASQRRSLAPHTIVVELPQRHRVESIVFDNTRAQEDDYPGISAREVEVWFSTASPETGYELVATVQATQGGREEFPLPPAGEARWIKLVVNSNWGNDEFTELMELEAYGTRVGEVVERLPVSGTYLTNFGSLYLEQAGNRIRGCYDGGTAFVSGRVDGRVMHLDWREKSGSGRALLTVSTDGGFLNGLWYEGNELQGTWRGPRDPADPAPPCEISQIPWPEQ